MLEQIGYEQFKEKQRESWNASAGGWRRWCKAIEEGGAHRVTTRLLELVNIKPDHLVLDIATGHGEPAISSARAVSPNGYVVATDISSKMLSIAKERAASIGLRNIEFREVDAEELNFKTSSFNAVLSRWGLMFMPRLPLVLNKIQNFLVEGGIFASALRSLK
jgi:ubiquinone/menaquinone biosynthesis C-methylase UbiE